jgi:hypothetical protein
MKNRGLQEMIKFLVCKYIFRGHKWEYKQGGGKSCPRIGPENDIGCSIPVYDLRCIRCRTLYTVGEDELINFLARPAKDFDY